MPALPKPGHDGKFLGNYPRKSQLFRLVKYYNLPRYMYI